MKQITTFQQRFKEIVGDRSATEIATLLEISKQSVSAYLLGTRKPKRLSIDAMARCLNVNPTWLMGYDAEKISPSEDLTAQLTEEDKMDIAYHLDIMLKNLDANEGLMFDGEPMNKRTKEALKASFEHTLIVGKIMSKEEVKNNGDDK